MLFQDERIPFWQVIADIMSWILMVFKPVVQPIGAFMVFWIDFLLQFFPSDNITIYIVIFCILVGAAIYINCRWPGEMYISVFKKDDDGSTKSIEHLDKKKKIQEEEEGEEDDFDTDSFDDDEREPFLD